MTKPADPLENSSDQSDCSSKFYLPRALVYPVIALLIAGAILIFSE